MSRKKRARTEVVTLTQDRYEVLRIPDGGFEYHNLFNSMWLNQHPSPGAYRNIETGTVLDVKKNSVVVERWSAGKLVRSKKIAGRRPAHRRRVQVHVDTQARVRMGGVFLTDHLDLIVKIGPARSLVETVLQSKGGPMTIESKSGPHSAFPAADGSIRTVSHDPVNEVLSEIGSKGGHL